MRSIPMAMTWEVLERGRWGLAAAALGAIALPAIILMALRHEGPLDPRDPSMLIMHVVVMHINLLIFGAAIFAAQGRMSQLYAYPARTSAIVAWRLLPAMAIISLETVVSIVVLNAVFDLGWPLWGPALFVAVAFAAVEAALWLTEKSVAWLIVALTVVGAVFGLWFKSRYGPMFSDPTRLWQEVTPAEVFTMLSMAAAAYWVAVMAVARNRRGEPPFSLGIMDWLSRNFAPAPAVGGRLTTPADALFWFEWRRKGWAMPVVVLFFLVVGVSIWLFASRNAEDLFQGFLVGGGLLSFVGFIGGYLMGNVGPNDANFAMGHFLATRPMTDPDMARTILRTAAKSVLLAWTIWATAFLIACGLLVATGDVPSFKFPEGLNWWYFPGTLLGLWIAVGTLTSIGLAGRPRLVFQLLCGLAVAVIAMPLFSKFVLSREAQLLLGHMFVAAVGGTLLIGTAWIFAAARRRLLIQSPTLWAAAVAWAATAALVVLRWPLDSEPLLPAYLLLAGILALAVAPLAAAPLAIAWNRHR